MKCISITYFNYLYFNYYTTLRRIPANERVIAGFWHISTRYFMKWMGARLLCEYSTSELSSIRPTALQKSYLKLPIVRPICRLGVWDRSLMTRPVSDRPWSWSCTFTLASNTVVPAALPRCGRIMQVKYIIRLWWVGQYILLLLVITFWWFFARDIFALQRKSLCRRT